VLTAELRDDQRLPLRVTAKDHAGNPATVDGAPTWESSDLNVLTVEPSADGMTCFAVPVALGTADVTVTADADLGEGVTSITNVITITITPGTADHLDIEVLPAEDLPATP
jgi:hypothetical protein